MMTAASAGSMPGPRTQVVSSGGIEFNVVVTPCGGRTRRIGTAKLVSAPELGTDYTNTIEGFQTREIPVGIVKVEGGAAQEEQTLWGG